MFKICEVKLKISANDARDRDSKLNKRIKKKICEQATATAITKVRKKKYNNNEKKQTYTQRKQEEIKKYGAKNDEETLTKPEVNELSDHAICLMCLCDYNNLLF